MMARRWTAALLLSCCFSSGVIAFTATTTNSNARTTTTQLNANNLGKIMASALLVSTALASPVLADEYGVETEAPTLFTGETVMVRLFC